MAGEKKTAGVRRTEPDPAAAEEKTEPAAAEETKPAPVKKAAATKPEPIRRGGYIDHRDGHGWRPEKR